MISEAGGEKKQKSQTIVLHQRSQKPFTLWTCWYSVIYECITNKQSHQSCSEPVSDAQTIFSTNQQQGPMGLQYSPAKYD